MREVVDGLARFPGRGPCTDAERRAALWLHGELARRGHEAWVETYWVRPQWALSLVLHGTLGVAASLLAPSVPEVALGVAVVTLLSWVLEIAGRGRILSLLLPRRATQVVLTEPADPEAIALVITASYDAPRRGLVFRDGVRRIVGRVARGPGAATWIALALALVAAAAGARVAGAEGTWLGAVQFLPTVLLLLAVAAALDVALSAVSPGAGDNASGVAVALALHDELLRQPPAKLSPALLLAGAGEGLPLSARAHLRRERPDPARTVLLEVGPSGAGAPRWWSRHGQLRAAAETAQATVPDLGAAPRALQRPAAARARGLPGIHVRALDATGIAPRARQPSDVPAAVDPEAMDAVLDFALAVVDALDADLAARVAAPAATPTAAGR